MHGRYCLFSMGSAEKIAATLLCLVLGLVSILVWPRYEGSMGPFILFSASFLAMALLALPRPRSYAYTFLAAFLFLGFWSKFSAHTLFDYPFLEPTGSFDGSGTSWDTVLVASSLAALGLALARLLYLALRLPRRSRREKEVPSWYATLRKPVWIITLISIVALNAANAAYGFIQIGLAPRLVLPAHLNIAAAWLVNVGFALWIATLVFWEGRTRPDRLGLSLFAPLLEGLLSTSSMLSRKNFLFHAVPYALVLLERRSWRVKLGSMKRLALIVAFLVAFAVSLVAVSVVRIYAYLPPEPPAVQGPAVESTEAQTPAEESDTEELIVDTQAAWMTRQVLGLAVDRWTGLEGIMAVSSYPGLGRELLLQGILEDPNTGEGSIYQRVAGAEKIYAESERTTFLTLPGSAAILLFSGSPLVVLLGMGTVASLLMLVECAIRRLLGNPFLASVSGLLMAYAVADLNFPYLGAIFLAQLATTLLFIWVLQDGAGLLQRGKRAAKGGST